MRKNNNGRRVIRLSKALLLFILIFENLFPNEGFLESFIRYYDVSTVGRYTHEYHPFLFEKSSYSLDELEQKVAKSGFSIKGRIVLTGYEENAIPAYFTHYKVCTGAKINDEVRVKSEGGWAQQLHNKFGVMTGYLFRDVPEISAFHVKSGQEELFDHINPEIMPIYDKKSYIFQRHAFGSMLPIMRKEQEIFCQHMIDRNGKGIFFELVNFWQRLYEHELRFGNRQVLGTQDVLFSIAHAQHLLRSDIPLLRYYVGPDITYPIKVSKIQKCSATRNAQTFVKKFVKQLRPIDNKSTVYIFCSFVDGVGKSTLLGNVQNYKKYGDDFDHNDPVDNSSSQLSQLYQYSKDVFIADLPAQMSHFTYKPDGMVYCDIFAMEEETQPLVDFVQKNKDVLMHRYQTLAALIRETIRLNGYLDASINEEQAPDRSFIRNLFLLKKWKDNKWIPFTYNGQDYLFHSANVHSIRKLVKLELADSVGLKNSEAEQMLFFSGVRFPYPYDFFVDDLLEKFKQAQIENVVFVDFLSMYPRSSRENIRINYLLQQISLLYEDFSAEKSLYGSFVSDAHFLSQLKNDQSGRFLHGLKKEAFVRLCLYNMMNNSALRTVEGISVEMVTQLLKRELATITPETVTQIGVLAAKKLDEEKTLLERVHGKTQNFINVQSLNFDTIIQFGEQLQIVFERLVKNDRLRELWRNPGDLIGDFAGLEGSVEQKIKLSDGSVGQVLFVFSPECRDEIRLAPILSTIRASWYGAIANLIGGIAASGSKTIVVENERCFVPPVWVKKSIDGKIVVFRREFKPASEKLLKEKPAEKSLEPTCLEVFNLFNIRKRIQVRWGEFKDKKYFLSLDRARTSEKLFAFGYTDNAPEKKWPALDAVVSALVYDEKHEKNKNVEDVVFAETLWKRVADSSYWKRCFQKVVDQAKKNFEKNKKDKKDSSTGIDTSMDDSPIKAIEVVKDVETPDEITEESPDKEKKEKEKNPEELIMLGKDDQIEPCKFVVRAFASLETILKDPYGQVAVRDDKKDFEAAIKLFEKVILPKYFSIVFEKDLFQDYSSVKGISEELF